MNAWVGVLFGSALGAAFWAFVAVIVLFVAGVL